MLKHGDPRNAEIKFKNILAFILNCCKDIENWFQGKHKNCCLQEMSSVHLPLTHIGDLSHSLTICQNSKEAFNEKQNIY